MYVMLDDDPPSETEAPDPALAVAQERIRGLEEQVAFLQEQLGLEHQRNAELVKELKAAQTSAVQERRGPWWLPW